MPGSTMLDPTRIMRIRALFAPSPSSPKVIEIGQVKEDPGVTGTGQTVMRELRSGDRVTKGNLLAVFYSVDVGNKKNDLIDAIYQLKLDSQILERWQAKAAVVPDVMLWQHEKNGRGGRQCPQPRRQHAADVGHPEADIQAVRDEAEKVKPEDAESDSSSQQANFDRWARVEIKAPDDGVIVERNITAHTVVSDNTLNLFQIAKLDEDGERPAVVCRGQLSRGRFAPRCSPCPSSSAVGRSPPSAASRWKATSTTSATSSTQTITPQR